MDKRTNVLNQNRRDIDFNKSVESGFTEEDMMNSNQKKIIDNQKLKLDRIEDISKNIFLTEMKLKLTVNVEKSADFCLQTCNQKYDRYNNKSFISVDSYPCIFNCLYKRHNIMMKILDNMSRSDLVKAKEEIEYDNLYEEPEYYREN